jgi:hypothetical protein
VYACGCSCMCDNYLVTLHKRTAPRLRLRCTRCRVASASLCGALSRDRPHTTFSGARTTHTIDTLHCHCLIFPNIGPTHYASRLRIYRPYLPTTNFISFSFTHMSLFPHSTSCFGCRLKLLIYSIDHFCFLRQYHCTLDL